MNGLLSMMWNNVDEVTDGIFSKMTTINKVKEGDDVSIGTTASNIAPDIYQSGAEFKQILEQPLVFAEEMGDIASGAIGHAFPKTTQTLDSLFNYTGREENMEKASQAKQGLLDTYGSKDAFLKEFQERPVSTVAMALGIGSGLKAVTKLSAPAINKAVNEMELQVSKGIDSIVDFGQSVDDLYSQNMGMTRLTGYSGNNVGAIFRELDMNKIGSGTGNAVEGHGLYISGQRGTGRYFAGEDSDLLDTFKKMRDDAKDPLTREIFDRAAFGQFPKNIREQMVVGLTNPADIDVLNKTLTDIEFEIDNSKAQLYEYDLNDEAIATFINREAPKAQQTQAVQTEMNRYGLGDDATGQILYNTIRADMLKQIQNRPNISVLELASEANKLTSEYLNLKGIKGMSFSDRVAIAEAETLQAPLNFDPRSYVIYDTDFAKVTKRQDIDIDKNTPSKEGASLGLLTDPTDVRFSSRKTEKRELEAGTFDEGGNILTGDDRIIVPNLDLRQLEGFPFIASYADLSRAGGYLTHVNGIKFPNPVKQAGGQDFMLIPENIDRGILWASKDSAISGLIKQAAQLKQITGKDPLYLPFRMSPTGLDFSHQTVDTMLQSAIIGLSKKEKAFLDKKIRTESKDSETGKMVNKNWKGIDSENPLANTTGAERKEISRLIDVNFRANRGLYTKGVDNGVISWTQARLANTDRSQLNKQEGTIQNIGQTKINEAIGLGDGSGHLSYDTALPGIPLGRSAHDIHITDLANIVASGGARKGQRITRDGLLANEIRQINMADVNGILTHDMLMDMEKRGVFDKK